jgi:hypothetical protein
VPSGATRRPTARAYARQPTSARHAGLLDASVATPHAPSAAQRAKPASSTRRSPRRTPRRPPSARHARLPRRVGRHATRPVGRPARATSASSTRRSPRRTPRRPPSAPSRPSRRVGRHGARPSAVQRAPRRLTRRVGCGDCKMRCRPVGLFFALWSQIDAADALRRDRFRPPPPLPSPNTCSPSWRHAVRTNARSASWCAVPLERHSSSRRWARQRSAPWRLKARLPGRFRRTPHRRPPPPPPTRTVGD